MFVFFFSFSFFGFVTVQTMQSRFCYYVMNFNTCDLVDYSSCNFFFFFGCLSELMNDCVRCVTSYLVIFVILIDEWLCCLRV